MPCTKCGKKSVYTAVDQGKLRAARLGGRREQRFLAERVDAWLLASSTPVIVNPQAPSGALREDPIKSAH